MSDLISNKSHPLEKIFSPSRASQLKELPHFISKNVHVGESFIKPRLHAYPELSSLKPGEAGIFKHNGKNVAAYRDHTGDLHVVSATCTHLGCHVAFNTAERSWDCPCHGSRFSLSGEVLHGPATKNLENSKQ